MDKAKTFKCKECGVVMVCDSKVVFRNCEVCGTSMKEVKNG